MNMKNRNTILRDSRIRTAKEELSKVWDESNLTPAQQMELYDILQGIMTLEELIEEGE